MKKLAIILLATTFMVSCGQKPDELDKLKAKLEKKKNEMSSLKGEIKELEAEIDKLDTNKKERLIAVKALAVEKGAFKNPIKLQGLVESDQDVTVSSEMGGKILSIHVKEGQRVSRGQLIAKLDAEAMRQQVAELKSAMDLAEVSYKKQKKLWDQNIGSEIQYLQAKNAYDRLVSSHAAAKANLSKLTITSPIAGNVDEVFANAGNILSPGLPVARVVNSREIQVKANVSERYLTKLNVGDEVKVFYPSLEAEYVERIASVGSYINPNNRTFNVVITPGNKNQHMKPNLLAIITAYDYKKEDVISVPTKLVRGEEGKNFVLIAEKDGNNYVVNKQEVEIERSFIDRTVIASGIESGDLIITEGYNKVVNKDKVKLLEN